MTPVRIVDCTLQVTAGRIVSRRTPRPEDASALSRGMERRARGVSPTTSRRRTRLIG
jgi:hypothetical protein